MIYSYGLPTGPVRHLLSQVPRGPLEWIISSQGFTVVAALHDLNIAAMYCDEIIAMKNGQVMGQGTPEELLNSQFISDLFEVEADVLRKADGKLLIAYKN